MANKLMYPIAKHKESGKLVNAKDAVNGKSCECICYYCNQEMIAVNNVTKQSPHFRHDLDADCAGSYESYIHWLAKEAIKEIDSIRFPLLGITDLFSFQENKINNLYNNYKVPLELRKIINNDLLEIINKGFDEIKIEKVETEKKYRSIGGDIVVDVVIQGNKQTFFIEPYYSNQIDNVKIQKLKQINISTVSINLIDFIFKKNHLYTLEELKNFISKNIASKSWEYINKEELISSALYNSVETRIKNNIEKFQQHQKLIQKNQEVNIEIEKIEQEIEDLRKNFDNEMRKLRYRINERENIKNQIQKHIENLDYY